MIESNRVIKVNRSYWEIADGGNIFKGTINNSFKGNRMPAVGDFVVTQKIDEEKLLILDLVEPKNELIKDYDEKNFKFTKFINGGKQVVATNIDKIFIVTSANNDFNIGKLERFVLMTDIPNSERFIILSKADVCKDINKYMQELASRFPDINVIKTSSLTGEGLKELLTIWKEKETAVFIGSSGVGKSTLVNSLYGREIAKTGEVRLRDDKGKHTTSATTLFEVSGNRYVIDTPGVREVGLLDVSKEELSELFNKIEEIAESCKKYKCTHTKEDGCAVKKAVEEGILDKKILERYIKLKNTKSRKKVNLNKSFKDKARSSMNKSHKRIRYIDEDF